MYTVYILYSHKIDRYYIGYSNDITRRLDEHNRRKGKFTDRGIPWVIVYTEDFKSKEKAVEREFYIKSQKSRIYIESLIQKRQYLSW